MRNEENGCDDADCRGGGCVYGMFETFRPGSSGNASGSNRRQAGSSPYADSSADSSA